jgi:hypothetical protein
MNPPQLRRLEDGHLVLRQKPQAQLRAIRTGSQHTHGELPKAEAEGEPFESLDRDRIGAAVNVEEHHRDPFRREEINRPHHHDGCHETGADEGRMDKSPAVTRALLEGQRQLLLDRGHDRKPPPGDLTDRSCLALRRGPAELG